nr:hypothetical protein [Tanacetum cinerariifolium]
MNEIQPVGIEKETLEFSKALAEYQNSARVTTCGLVTTGVARRDDGEAVVRVCLIGACDDISKLMLSGNELSKLNTLDTIVHDWEYLLGAEEGSFKVILFKVSSLNVGFDFKFDLIVFGPGAGLAPASFFSRGRGCYRLKIHLMNHNQSLKSPRQQLNDQLCFFVTHLRVPYQYHDLTK